MVKPKNVYRIVGLVLFALFLSWLTSFLAPKKPVPKDMQTADRHDYSLTSLHTEKFGSTGKIVYTLMAKSLKHYPGKNASLLTKPVLLQYTKQGDIVETSADNATLQDNNKSIEMQDNVVTTQRTRKGKVLARATSQQLVVQLQ